MENNTVIMASQIAPELTIEMAEDIYSNAKDEQAIADIYVDVENKAWWIEDDVYDYEVGSAK